MQQDLAAKAKEIENLRQEHKTSLANVTGEIKTLEDKCEALRAQLEAARSDSNSATEAMQAAHTAKIQELQGALAKAQAELVAERADAKAGRDLAVELASVKAASASLESSLATSFAAAESAKTQLREAQQQVEATRRAAKEAEQAAGKRQQQLELEKAALMAHVEGLKQEVESKSAALSSVSSSAGERESALAAQVQTLQVRVCWASIETSLLLSAILKIHREPLFARLRLIRPKWQKLVRNLPKVGSGKLRLSSYKHHYLKSRRSH